MVSLLNLLVACVTVAQWTGIVSADSPSATPGNKAVSVGVGCSSGTPYPTRSSAYGSSGPRFSYTFSQRSLPKAQFISLHFTKFNLPVSDYIVVRPTDANATEKLSFKYYGGEKSGAFFSNALYTTSVTLELFTGAKATNANNVFDCVGFAIDSFRYLAQPAMGSIKEDVCGADDSEEAACYQNTEKAVFNRSNAVMRLLIHKGADSFFCTGWLVGCEGHMLTNQHCISTQDHASNTEFEFHAQGDSCYTSCQTALGCPGSVRARSGTLVFASADYDYALVKLDINLSQDYGYLQLRESGAVMDERIYIPEHPGGFGKRIAMKLDSGGWGKVESLTASGCLANQVAYSLDTQGGSSGSPVLSWSDNSVVAIHHCGGCPNTAVNMKFIVSDMRANNILPKCALYTPPTPTSAPTTPPTWAPSPPPVPAPTPAPTLPPTQPPTTAPPPRQTTPPPQPVRATSVDGTISTTATVASIDYVDFSLAQAAIVELDILSMERRGDESSKSFVDVNGDCNAGYIDSSIVLFRVNSDGSIAESTALAVNDNAPDGYGKADGSISSADSYIAFRLDAGRYRVAVGVSPMTVAQAVAKSMPVSTTPRVCDSQISNYGSYRLTISTSADVTVVGPNSYIGSQCSSTNKVTPYSRCGYHTEAVLSNVVAIDGTLVRQSGAVTVDYIPFTVPAFGRVTIDTTSFESRDGYTYVDVNGFCTSSYVDAAAYLFRRPANGAALTKADVVNAGDDDDDFVLRQRIGVSFRDPYISLALPCGDYILAIGRYPMTVQAAIDKLNTNSPDQFTPESCGAKADVGNYRVTIASGRDLAAVSPNSFQGTRCPTNAGKQLC